MRKRAKNEVETRKKSGENKQRTRGEEIKMVTKISCRPGEK